MLQLPLSATNSLSLSLSRRRLLLVYELLGVVRDSMLAAGKQVFVFELRAK